MCSADRVKSYVSGGPTTYLVSAVVTLAPGGQTETESNQNISLTKDVRYVSGVTKINFGSLPDPLGSSRASGLARRSRATYIQS